MRHYTPNERGSALTDWLIAVAAVLALVISVITYYMTYYKPPKPFDPSISVGTPVLRETAGLLSITLAVPLTNSGDNPGCISDIGLTLESKTQKTKWNFFPTWQINMERYLKAPASKEDPFLAVEAPVSPVKVPGKSTQQLVFLFLPRSSDAPKLEPLRVDQLVPCETYVVSMFLLQGDANCRILPTSKYQLYTSTEFVLQANQKDLLSKGITVLPLDAPRDTLRTQFVGGRLTDCK
jgi:hypothetical protein